MRRLLLTLGLLLAPVAAHATCPVIPYVFPANSINPLQVNANFTSVRDCVNAASGFVQVNSSAALRALVAGSEPIVYRGYNTNPGDGMGLYYWSPASTCTDNGISCIKPDSNPASGRWLDSVVIASGLGGATIGNVLGDSASVARPGISAPLGIGFEKTTPTSTDGASILIARSAAFSGGTPGSVNTGLQSACSTVSGITSFEWCFLSSMYNQSTIADNSENAAGYFKAQKVTTGKTWAATFETDDYNTTDAGTGQAVAVEMDMYANDADLGANRGILHLVGNKRPGGTGVTPVITSALKIGDAGALATFSRGVWFAGNTATVGIDMRDMVYTSAAIWLRDDAPISWSTAGGAKTFFDSGTSLIKTVGEQAWTSDSAHTLITVLAASGGAYTTGIDMTAGDYSSAAIWLPSDKPLAWNTAGTVKTFYETSSTSVRTTGLSQSTGFIATAAAPTVAAAQVGYGSTVAAAANCNGGGGTPTACLVINVAGTTRYVPYF